MTILIAIPYTFMFFDTFFQFKKNIIHFDHIQTFELFKKTNQCLTRSSCTSHESSFCFIESPGFPRLISSFTLGSIPMVHEQPVEGEAKPLQVLPTHIIYERWPMILIAPGDLIHTTSHIYWKPIVLLGWQNTIVVCWNPWVCVKLMGSASGS